jgi:hypothetical protein
MFYLASGYMDEMKSDKEVKTSLELISKVAMRVD